MSPRIAVHERRRRHDGCAPWAVHLKTDGGIVGWGGLYTDPFDPGWGIEIGYSFHPDVWGKGLATELVTAALDLADTVLRLPEVRAFARPENAASRHILAKFGFVEVRFVPEMERLLFSRPRHAG